MYETVNENGELKLKMYNELQIESTRQYQTVVFYSQFLDQNATDA